MMVAPSRTINDAIASFIVRADGMRFRSDHSRFGFLRFPPTDLRLISDYAHPATGRFRSFLLASLKNFLTNEWDRRTAVKRGGRYEFISLGAAVAEVEFQSDARRELQPDRLYERRWALAVLEEARRRLEADYRTRGKHELFSTLSAHLAGDPDALPYAEVAGRLGLSAEATRKAVERMRRRYGQLLREAVAETVSSPEEIDEELRHLRWLLQG